jgi:hypothetical protein
MDVQAYREFMPFEIQAWAEHMGLDVLTRDTIVRALEIAKAEAGGSSDMELMAWRAMEMRSLAVLYPGEQLKPTLKRAENAIRVGQDTRFGAELSASPYRWACTIQSLLATKARLRP